MLQAAFLVGCAILGVFAVQNAADNLAAQGVTMGFGFFGNAVGFDVDWTILGFGPSASFLRALAVGFTNTLVVALLGGTVATVLGAAIGFGQASRWRIVSTVSSAYTEFVTNVPVLVQILFFYFAVFSKFPRAKESVKFLDFITINNRGLYFPRPALSVQELWVLAALLGFAAALLVMLALRRARRRRLASSVQASTTGGRFVGSLLLAGAVFIILGVLVWLGLANWEYPVLRGFNVVGGFDIPPTMAALVVGLSTYSAGFIATIVRDGRRTRVGEDHPIGLGREGKRDSATPALTVEYLRLLRNSSLAAALGYVELFTMSMAIIDKTGQMIEMLTIAAAIYLVIDSVGSGFARAIGAYLGATEAVPTLPHQGRVGAKTWKPMVAARVVLWSAVGAYAVYALVVPFMQWSFVEANFSGTGPEDCSGEGACWVVVAANAERFLSGLWQNLFMALVSTAVAVPVGIELARARRSGLPTFVWADRIFRWLVLRLPLVLVIFAVVQLLPLLTSADTFGRKTMSIVGLTLFAAALIAYAFDTRPARDSDGVSPAQGPVSRGWRAIDWRNSVADVLDVFVRVFKATTLVSIIGGRDLLLVMLGTVTRPPWRGTEAEGFFFAVLVFWIVCFGVGRVSNVLRHSAAAPPSAGTSRPHRRW